MTINQISVFLENKSGRIAEVTRVLADAGINLRALTIADTADFGILRIIADNYEKAKKALEENNFTTRVTRVLGVEVEDKPGALYNIMKIFTDNGINIEYLYATLERKDGKSVMIFKVASVEQGLKIARENALVTISGDDF